MYTKKTVGAFILEASRRILKGSKCFRSGGITEGFMEAVASSQVILKGSRPREQDECTQGAGHLGHA